MRLDDYITGKNLVQSRSQAQDLIKRSKVRVGTKIVTKPAWRIHGNERIQLLEKESYVSRAGLKLSSVSKELGLDFKDKIVLDVGSSTGGFTDYALRNGAKKVVAVDVGTEQLHPSLRLNSKVMLFEKTDIRDFVWPKKLSVPDIVVGDLSFISLTKVLPSIEKFITPSTICALMAKPQFEAEGYKLNSGVVKNSKDRREILARLEKWFLDNKWLVVAKRDSSVSGASGNVEKFYLLRHL